MTATNNNFSVETIVTKYRNYVDAHTTKMDLYDSEIGFYSAYADLEDSASDEQLLVTLYNDVADSLADKRVLRILSKYASHYYKEALNNDEYSYLMSNYKAAVSFMFSHKRKSYNTSFPLESLTSDDSEYKFIESTQLKPDSNVFLYGSLRKVADMAILLHDCNVYVAFDRSSDLIAWALIQIRLFAYGRKVEMLRYRRMDNFMLSVRTDMAIVEVDAWKAWRLSLYANDYSFTHITTPLSKGLYDSLTESGKLFIRSREEYLIGNSYAELKKQMILDKSLVSITASDKTSIMGNHFYSYEVIVDKSGVDCVSMINQIKGQQCIVRFDELVGSVLIPSFYLTDKPTQGVPLSNLVEFSDFRMPTKKEKIMIKEENDNMPTISPLDLSDSYAKANMQNMELKSFSYYNKMLEEMPLKLAEEAYSYYDAKYIINGSCVIIRGADDRMKVGYLDEDVDREYGLTSNDMICLKPKSGINVQYVAALFLSKEISSVLLSIGNGSINWKLMACLLSRILIPNRTELEQYKYVSEVNNEALNQLLEEQKRTHEHYEKAVRMRKHALTQSFSAMKAMFSALDFYRKRQNGVMNDSDRISRVKETTVEDAFVFLSENFDEMGIALERIADINYSFGKTEWIDPELFIENYIAQNSNGWLNFKAITSWKHGDNQLKDVFWNHKTDKALLPKRTSVAMFYFPKRALEHIFNNVITNARSHGFNNNERNDYQILFSLRIEGDSLIIEIANNGTPIPVELDTEYILEYGTSTSLHQDGHNGIGCHEIDVIMREYDGRVKVISTPTEDFTVKYILKFNHVNIRR